MEKAKAKGKPIGRPVVVAKVEWHQGELFSRVGFIVTNLTARPKGVDYFYNGRGTAEQWMALPEKCLLTEKSGF